MKKILIIFLCLSFLLTGCMGTIPKPIDVYQYGDEQKSCNMISDEIKNIDIKIEERHKHRSSKITGNVFIGIVGCLLLWPALFLMDTKSDELKEIDSLSKRKDTLKKIYIDNGCEE